MTHQQLIELWFEEVWNKGRREAIAEYMSPKAIVHEGDQTSTFEDFLEYFERMHGAFSNMRIVVEQTITEGDLVCARWSGRFHHTGPGFGPPTGREMHVTGITIARIQDGRFMEGWQNWDALSLHQQIVGARGNPAALKQV